MVRRLALQRKMPSAQIDCHIRGPGTAVSTGVNSVTIETRAPQGAVPRFRPLLQPWMNCIWVPARSMMSPFFSEITPSPTWLPLTVGCDTPSTCDST